MGIIQKKVNTNFNWLDIRSSTVDIRIVWKQSSSDCIDIFKDEYSLFISIHNMVSDLISFVISLYAVKGRFWINDIALFDLTAHTKFCLSQVGIHSLASIWTDHKSNIYFFALFYVIDGHAE